MKKTILDFQKRLTPIQQVSTSQQQKLKGGGGGKIVEEEAEGI